MAIAVSVNARAVEHLFRSHHHWLRQWLSGRYRSVSADDVASEVFLRFMVMPYVDEVREPRAMMTTMASRIVTELRRRTGLFQALEAELASQPSPVAPSPEEQFAVAEALRAIDAILQDLCPKARAAFLLNRVDGMTQQEIAQRLNVSTRTVERYLAQGMRLALSLQRDR